MKTDKLTVNRIFDRTERLEAPLFQRPYVWREERNWKPLWESIQAIAYKRLNNAPVRPHFMGTIVLDQLETQTAKLHARQIIDGQQRLTTLQVTLAAARDLCYELGHTRYGDAFKKLTYNDAPLSEDPDDIFKAWPTNADQDEFRRVMTANSIQSVRNLSIRGNGLIRDGYLFFADAFQSWLSDNVDDKDFLKGLDALHTAIREDLNLVVIDLEEGDDAQEIFETLNALGTPLLPADLVKNFLFRLAESHKEDPPKLYVRYWKQFDDEKSYWREEVRQGRLKRARLDLFLNHYLTMMKGEEVIISQMFLDYRDLVASRDALRASDHMEHFRSYADVYQSFDSYPADSREGLFFYRLDQMDITTLYPLLLEVFKLHASEGNRKQLEQIITDLESFLVRRAAGCLTPKNYNRFFAQLVMRLRANKNDFSAEAIRRHLLAERADTQRWPDDKEFGDAWLSVDFYKRLKKASQRMVLEAIEAGLHTDKTEKVRIEDKLTIEHLLPVEWEEHWPLVVKEDTPEAREETKRRRDECLHKVGNLTLLTRKLNPSVSNGPWHRKRQAILKHSALNLNRVFQDVENWNEGAIETRSRELLKIALKIWPHPGKQGN